MRADISGLLFINLAFGLALARARVLAYCNNASRRAALSTFVQHMLYWLNIRGSTRTRAHQRRMSVSETDGYGYSECASLWPPRIPWSELKTHSARNSTPPQRPGERARLSMASVKYSMNLANYLCPSWNWDTGTGEYRVKRMVLKRIRTRISIVRPALRGWELDRIYWVFNRMRAATNRPNRMGGWPFVVLFCPVCMVLIRIHTKKWLDAFNVRPWTSCIVSNQ